MGEANNPPCNMAVNIRVKVHPVVLFQIADAYERRDMEKYRVIGTLLGNVDKQSVEITSCYCVPHKDYEERVDVDVVYNQDMLELNKKVSPGENLVGWFTTGNDVTSHSSLIHDYYSRETKDPIHLTVDITPYEPEVTGLDLLHKCKFTKLRQVETIPDLAKISEGTTKLEVMLDAVISYVQGVLEGRETPNNDVGRKLLELVNSVPKMSPDEFEND